MLARLTPPCRDYERIHLRAGRKSVILRDDGVYTVLPCQHLQPLALNATTHEYSRRLLRRALRSSEIDKDRVLPLSEKDLTAEFSERAEQTRLVCVIRRNQSNGCVC